MISDETLIRDYLEGDSRAIESLIRRYQTPLWYYARGVSWYKDKSFIDEIIQLTLTAIIKGIQDGEFSLSRPEPFKSWAYQVCQNICWNENKKYAHQPKHISQMYPEELPDHLTRIRPAGREYHNLSTELDKVLTKLSPEERQLISLVIQNKTYKVIQKIEPFDKYSLEMLRQKVCRLRRLMIQLRKEARNGDKKK